MHTPSIFIIFFRRYQFSNKPTLLITILDIPRSLLADSWKKNASQTQHNLYESILPMQMKVDLFSAEQSTPSHKMKDEPTRRMRVWVGFM